MVRCTAIDIDGSVIDEKFSFWYITGNLSKIYPFIFALSVDPKYGGIYQFDIQNDRAYRLTTEPTNSIHLAIDDAVEHIKVFWTVYCPDVETAVTGVHNVVHWFEYDYVDLPVMSSGRLIPSALRVNKHTIVDMTAVAIQNSVSRYNDDKSDIMLLIADYRTAKKYIKLYTQVDWTEGNYGESFKRPVDKDLFVDMYLSGTLPTNNGAILSPFNLASQVYNISSTRAMWFSTMIMVKDAILLLRIEQHQLIVIKYVGALSVLPTSLSGKYLPHGAVTYRSGNDATGKQTRSFVFMYESTGEDPDAEKYCICHGVSDISTADVTGFANFNIIPSWTYYLEDVQEINLSPYSPRAGGEITVEDNQYTIVGNILIGEGETNQSWITVSQSFSDTMVIAATLLVYSGWHTLVSGTNHADVYGTNGHHLRIYAIDSYRYRQYPDVEFNRVTANGNFSHICRSDGIMRLKFNGVVVETEMTAPTLTRILNAISRIETKLDGVLYNTQRISYHPKT